MGSVSDCVHTGGTDHNGSSVCPFCDILIYDIFWIRDNKNY